MAAAQIIVLGEQVGLGGIIDDHALVGADDVAEHGFGTGGTGDRLLTQRDLDLVASGLGLCLNQIVVLGRQDQKTAIRARVLERDRHQPLDQRW